MSATTATATAAVSKETATANAAVSKKTAANVPTTVGEAADNATEYYSDSSSSGIGYDSEKITGLWSDEPEPEQDAGNNAPVVHAADNASTAGTASSSDSDNESDQDSDNESDQDAGNSAPVVQEANNAPVVQNNEADKNTEGKWETVGPNKADKVKRFLSIFEVMSLIGNNLQTVLHKRTTNRGPTETSYLMAGERKYKVSMFSVSPRCLPVYQNWVAVLHFRIFFDKSGYVDQEMTLAYEDDHGLHYTHSSKKMIKHLIKSAQTGDVNVIINEIEPNIKCIFNKEKCVVTYMPEDVYEESKAEPYFKKDDRLVFDKNGVLISKSGPNMSQYVDNIDPKQSRPVFEKTYPKVEKTHNFNMSGQAPNQEEFPTLQKSQKLSVHKKSQKLAQKDLDQSQKLSVHEKSQNLARQELDLIMEVCAANKIDILKLKAEYIEDKKKKAEEEAAKKKAAEEAAKKAAIAARKAELEKKKAELESQIAQLAELDPN